VLGRLTIATNGLNKALRLTDILAVQEPIRTMSGVDFFYTF